MEQNCCTWLCKPIIGCCSCLLCDCLCCECNCIIFPAPRPTLALNDTPITAGDVTISYFKFAAVPYVVMQNGRSIPYVQLSTPRSRLSNRCFIYFHGNAQDIRLVPMFLQPLVQDLNITFYSIQYPTYSSYSLCCPALISNRIKQDSLAFHDYLIRGGRTVSDIFVMGRSIGSGGASYLSAHKNVPLLVLMSPFDSIRKVAMSMVGWMGCVIKQHFDNEEEIVNFNGRLLVIHGEVDEVIGVLHGKNLVKTYQKGNAYKNTAKTIYPLGMSHNSFDLEVDIIAPIAHFIDRP